MRRAATILLALGVLIGAGSPAAKAKVPDVSPALQLPDPMPIVVDAPCPYQEQDPTVGACYYRMTPSGRPAIFVQEIPGVPWLLDYELGHVWADQRLDAGERNRITRALGLSGRPWSQNLSSVGAWLHSPETQVAQAYASCREHFWPSRHPVWPQGYHAKTDRQQRDMCALLGRAGLDPA